jgi:site-specific recombinase XerD
VCPQVRKTQQDYIRHVEQFAKFLGRSPDTATGEDLRRHQVHQTKIAAQPPTLNSSAVALRLLFTVTLGCANLAAQLIRAHYPRRLPRVLSTEEVGRLIEATPGPGLKYKTALTVAYRTGLRASEVVALKVSDTPPKLIVDPHAAGRRTGPWHRVVPISCEERAYRASVRGRRAQRISTDRPSAQGFGRLERSVAPDARSQASELIG